jgi:hypothetical protein
VIRLQSERYKRTCGRCIRYGWCARCNIATQAGDLLDDGTGRIHPALQPLADALAAAPNPKLTLRWLARPHIRAVLADLATGRLALTHQALASHPNWRAVIYLRDLLVSCGALPAADKQLLDFQAWLHRRLTALAAHPHIRLLRQFGLWHYLPRMHAKAAIGPLRYTARQYAQGRFRQAEVFLTWVADRGRSPSAVTQADIDTFYACHRIHQRQAVRAFLTWAMEHHHIPKHELPRVKFAVGDAITQERRLALLRRFVTDTGAPLRPRTAACLMLLYAQPLSRVLQLTAADLTRDPSGQTFLRLGDPPSPVPEPFAALLHRLAADKPASPWLFPGRHPGQPVAYRSMLVLLHDLGLPMRTARISALRQLVLQAPAPVIAGALGFHHTTTTRQHTNAAGPWSRYASSPVPQQSGSSE